MLSKKSLPRRPAWKNGPQLNIIDHSTFVQNQNAGQEVFPEFTFEAAAFLGGAQLIDDIDGVGKEDRVALQAGRVAQGGG